MKTRQCKLFHNIENAKESKLKLKKEASYECVSEKLKFDAENIPKLIIRKKKRKLNNEHIIETNQVIAKNATREFTQLPNNVISDHLLRCSKFTRYLDCRNVYDIISKIKLNDNESWNNLYSPKIAENFLNGNNKSVLKFKNWLQNWNQSKVSSKQTPYSDDSDFEPSENIKESSKKQSLPVCIIQGNRGVGKSSLVHATANQLNYTVFECNSSSRRTGKDVLDQLENAAISQQVSLQIIDKPVEKSLKSSKQTDSKKGITSFFEPVAKKAKVEQTMKRQNSSLVIENRALFLFDDVDVLMEEDKGFFGAICTLIEKRNRPIIFTAFDSAELKNCISKIGKHAYLKVHIEHNSIKDIAVYLQLILLSRGFVVQHGDMLQWIFSCNYKMDIRSCLNNLQFYFVNGRLDFKPKLEPLHWNYYKLKELRNKLAVLSNGNTDSNSDTKFSEDSNSVCKQSLRNLSSYLNILRVIDSQIPQRNRTNCRIKERDSTIDSNCFTEYDHNVVVSSDISETLTLLYNKTLHNSMTKFETDVLLTSSTPEFNKVRKPSSFPNQMIVDIQNRITHAVTARSVISSSTDRIDRLHFLKMIASSEEKRRTNFTQRRFTHYFDRINIHLQDLDLKYSLSSYKNS